MGGDHLGSAIVAGAGVNKVALQRLCCTSRVRGDLVDGRLDRPGMLEEAAGGTLLTMLPRFASASDSSIHDRSVALLGECGAELSHALAVARGHLPQQGEVLRQVLVEA
jgi:hypothetical protein